LFWFAHIQVPPQFLQESDFVRHNSKGGSYFLLPQGFLETIQTNPQK
jgi:hypothetical protein